MSDFKKNDRILLKKDKETIHPVTEHKCSYTKGKTGVIDSAEDGHLRVKMDDTSGNCTGFSIEASSGEVRNLMEKLVVEKLVVAGGGKGRRRKSRRRTKRKGSKRKGSKRRRRGRRTRSR